MNFLLGSLCVRFVAQLVPCVSVSLPNWFLMCPFCCLVGSLMYPFRCLGGSLCVRFVVQLGPCVSVSLRSGLIMCPLHCLVGFLTVHFVDQQVPGGSVLLLS